MKTEVLTVSSNNNLKMTTQQEIQNLPALITTIHTTLDRYESMLRMIKNVLGSKLQAAGIPVPTKEDLDIKFRRGSNRRYSGNLKAEIIRLAKSMALEKKTSFSRISK
jgi:hypothetical protein